jgi:hypothetical protein
VALSMVSYSDRVPHAFRMRNTLFTGCPWPLRTARSHVNGEKEKGRIMVFRGNRQTPKIESRVYAKPLGTSSTGDLYPTVQATSILSTSITYRSIAEHFCVDLAVWSPGNDG